jgi:hypothetical protein
MIEYTVDRNNFIGKGIKNILTIGHSRQDEIFLIMDFYDFVDEKISEIAFGGSMYINDMEFEIRRGE